MDASTLQATLDLSQFSAAECSRIWDVLQKDFQLRYEETKRLERLQSRVSHASEKVKMLYDVENFNEKYCIVCFESFIFILNPSYECCVCTCNVCRKCSRYVSKFEQRICQLCEEEKNLAAQRCVWFYKNSRKTFVVNNNPSPIKLPPNANNDDPVTMEMRRYLEDFVNRYKSSEGKFGREDQGTRVESREAAVGKVTATKVMAASAKRDETEEALKRITGTQIMRFRQKINAVATDVRSYLRAHVCYEIPEVGVDKHYDHKVAGFKNDVIEVLRNFSQTLYIAIEGYHSRSNLPLKNVHQEVQVILQDEVENLVGYRVDVRNDDEVASTVSDEECASSVYGPTHVQEKFSQILIDKWLEDHQTYLDDQRLTATDLYTHTALENFLEKKRDSPDFGGMTLDDEDMEGYEDEIMMRRQKPAFHSPLGVLNEVDPDLLSLQDSRQLENSFGEGSSGAGTGNWLLRGRPNVSGSYGEAMHHFSDTPSPRVGVRQASELSDELSANAESLESNDEEDVNNFLSQMEREHMRKKSSASIDFDDVYNQNLTFYSPSSPEKEKGERELPSRRSEDSGVQLNGHATPGVQRGDSGASDGDRRRKVSLGFSRMDWSFSERSDPHFISKMTEVACKVAECATIVVEVDGTMPIDVYWYRATSDDLQQLEESDRVEFVSAADHPGKHTLHIWHLRESDAGEYLAVAVNEKGSNKQGFKISVEPNDQALKAPEFQKELTGDEVRVNDTARLRCKVVGCPPPRVVFTKGGSSLKDDNKYQFMKIGDRSYTLSVYDVQQEDVGAYTCTATNAAGSCRSSASIAITSTNLSPPRESELLVDTSPAVNVRQQVRKLGHDEPPGATLFLDQIEPLTKPSVGDLNVSALVAASQAPPRARPRKDSADEKERPIAARSSASLHSVPKPKAAGSPRTSVVTPPRQAQPLEAEDGFVVDHQDDVIDCGLKRVNSRYRKDFFVNRPSAASSAAEPRGATLQPPGAESPAPAASSQAKRVELRPAARSPASVSFWGDADGRLMESQPLKSDGQKRESAIDHEEAFSTIKDRFEKGISRPFSKNMHASFRTRKFPSVAAIRTQFSMPAKGSYLKRDTSTLSRSPGSPRWSKSKVTKTTPAAAPAAVHRTQSIDSAASPLADSKDPGPPEFCRVKLKPVGRPLDD